MMRMMSQTWNGKADSKSANVMLPSLKADLLIRRRDGHDHGHDDDDDDCNDNDDGDDDVVRTKVDHGDLYQ